MPPMISAIRCAATHAAMRADANLEKRDLDGYVVWKRILWGQMTANVGLLSPMTPAGGSPARWLRVLIEDRWV